MLPDLRQMLEEIVRFFRYMVDNREGRLYYMLPLVHKQPYAYQHSSIRDIATICDILDTIELCRKHKTPLDAAAALLFEHAASNTLRAYNALYQQDGLPSDDANIADIGFFLLCLRKAQDIVPTALPPHWKETQARQKAKLLTRQNADGSMRIFFDDRLKIYEKSSEAFYLPEAVIGLIATAESSQERLACEKACLYCSQENIRKQNMASENATFYANWQFQLLYHGFQEKVLDEKAKVVATQHLLELVRGCVKSRIASEPFGNEVATVEVACFLEGLVHARQSLELLRETQEFDNWFIEQVARALSFLYEVQREARDFAQGGFVHFRSSTEARVDVAGHVVGALRLLFSRY